MRLVSIEPAPPNVALLRRNLARAGAAGRVAVVESALGEAAGRAKLAYYPRMPGNSTLHPRAKWEQRVAFQPARRRAMFRSRRYDVRVETLSEVLRAHGGGAPVELLKLDVEGSEGGALRGVADEDWRRIRQVVVEVHGGAARGEVEALLRRRFGRVRYTADEELRRCGLDHGILTAAGGTPPCGDSLLQTT